MGFYREERVQKSHSIELTLVASRTRMYPNGYNMLNRPVLRAPAVHGVSSFNAVKESDPGPAGKHSQIRDKVKIGSGNTPPDVFSIG